MLHPMRQKSCEYGKNNNTPSSCILYINAYFKLRSTGLSSKIWFLQVGPKSSKVWLLIFFPKSMDGSLYKGKKWRMPKVNSSGSGSEPLK